MYMLFQHLFFYFVSLIISQVNNCICAADTNADAKSIFDSKFDPKTIAKILPFRTQEECSAINQAIANLNGGKPLVDPKYIPLENTKPYDDLIFALVNDSMTVFSMYLGQYLDRKEEIFIDMVFIQVDDRCKLKEIYNSQHERSFDDARKKNDHPFQNALRVWAETNRENATPPCQLDMSCVQGQNLADERHKWNKDRDMLEYILMKKEMSESRNAIRCYETTNPTPANLIDDIKNKIKNQDLVEIYTALVRYVKNGDTYLAQILHDYCDGQDNWAIWIIVLTTRRGDQMKPIDTAFQDLFSKVALKDYINKCNVQDPILKQMLIDLADSASISKRQKPPPPSPDPNDDKPYPDDYFDEQ